MAKVPIHPFPTKFRRNSRVVLYPGDAGDFLRTIPDKSVSLVITSPPYNLGKDYETRIAVAEYLISLEPIIVQLRRVLKDEGSICWQVGNFIDNGEIVPLDILFYDSFKQLNFKLRNRIIWHFGHGLHSSRRFSGRYETLMWFTKTDSYTFNLDDIRVAAKYPGKRHYKSANKGELSGNPNGKNPSDVWKILLEEWETAFWEIPNVKANHPEKTFHPCQFPVELAQRCVLAFTKPGGLVLDPFAGTGTSLIAAIMHDRRAIGAEKNKRYYKLATGRIHSFLDGTLKVRPLGKPVYAPTGSESVAQVPDEWKRRKSSG